MTPEEQAVIEALLNPDEVIVSITYTKIMEDSRGFPIFSTDYVNPPSQYRHITTIYPYGVAILQDLGYVAP
ncbi:hypothetical protein WCX49_06705 [Sulfurimonas sp. HSL-1656]|uniref:hypothetical protein n=1 Tax=Thiomicrolovo subterrani TaxID=3131934 RepID=UPI0031F7566E